MKYAIIIPDGCADWPIEFLGGRTPLQAARTPHLDALAESGIVGRSGNVPAELPPGSDVATLSLLGYDPLRDYTGRAPLEAVAQGIELDERDWAFRCNLVTIESGVMRSFTAGHISTEEANELLESLQAEIAPRFPFPLRFLAGVGYRNLMLFSDVIGTTFDIASRTSPPHDHTNKPVEPALPNGPGAELLLRIMRESREIFADHPVNRRRIEEGKLPASQCWLWGQGKKPNLEPFARRFRKEIGTETLPGGMITAVDLLRGIGKLIGWEQIAVPGITGYVDTDYAAKGRFAAEGLKKHDIVCVHIEAPDEAGHEGNLEKKIAALEEIDVKIVPPIVEALRQSGDWRLLVSPDHPTPVAHKTHTHGHVPWVVAGSDIAPMSRDGLNGPARFDEPTAERSSFRFEPGWQLMPWFLKSRK